MNRFKATLLIGAVGTLCASAANAITVDGVLEAAYGAPTAHVTYLSGAPNSNFAAPTPFSDSLSYDIYLKATGGFVYGYIDSYVPVGAPGAPGVFSNLYFDLNPTVADGSDLGFELSPGAQNAFIPGVAGTLAVGGIAVVSNGTGGLEFSIPDAYFTGPIAGLNYYAGQTFEPNVTLRLSQSFGYSVNGGPTYGPDRLGTVTLAAVPEPETYALMLGGLGLVGMLVRRRKVC